MVVTTLKINKSVGRNDHIYASEAITIRTCKFLSISVVIDETHKAFSV